MTCLVCRTPLVEREDGQQCPTCGYWYPPEVLMTGQAHPEKWARIQTERLYCLECEQDLPGLPKVWGRDGQPIPCPIHTRRVWWRRWFRLGSPKRSRNTTQAD